MPAITLPDGSVRSFDGPVTGTAIAEAIGPGLAKAALAMEVNGALQDIGRAISKMPPSVLLPGKTRSLWR